MKYAFVYGLVSCTHVQLETGQNLLICSCFMLDFRCLVPIAPLWFGRCWALKAEELRIPDPLIIGYHDKWKILCAFYREMVHEQEWALRSGTKYIRSTY